MRSAQLFTSAALGKSLPFVFFSSISMVTQNISIEFVNFWENLWGKNKKLRVILSILDKGYLKTCGSSVPLTWVLYVLLTTFVHGISHKFTIVFLLRFLIDNRCGFSKSFLNFIWCTMAKLRVAQLALVKLLYKPNVE